MLGELVVHHRDTEAQRYTENSIMCCFLRGLRASVVKP
jgi:hypothetical protein